MKQPRSIKKLAVLATTALAIGAALLCASTSFAQPMGHGHSRMDGARMEKMMEHRVERMAKSVDATPEQKTKLHEIAKAAQADIKPLHEQARARIEKAMAQAREVLTPEQRTKWDAKTKSMREHMDKRMGEKMDKPAGDKPK